MEEQLLPRKELAPVYEKAVWLYVYRDFSKNEADQAAERTCLRFGFTSYPQHHLLHPETFARLATAGRSLDGFLAAFDRAKVGKIHTTTGPSALSQAEKRAADLEKSQSKKAALKALEDPDIVVCYRAVEILAEKDPTSLVSRAAELLVVPNDPLRFLLCEVLKKEADPSAARALEAQVKEPTASLNPNVLRIRSVQALGACGDAASVEVIAPYAKGPWNNGLTRISITALGEIATRDKKARKPAVKALAASFPAPPDEKANARVTRATLGIAKHVHTTLEKVTGKKKKFPDPYDEPSREKLIKAWD